MARSVPEYEQQAWEKWLVDRDERAAERLIKKYEPLVDYHVQKIASGLPRNIAYEELKSHGMYGLFDALTKFDVQRDLKFDTYASFRIRGAILDGLRKEDWLPRSLREKAKKIEAVQERLEQKLLRTATVEEVAQACQMNEREVLRIHNESFFSHLLSVDDDRHDEERGESQSDSFMKDMNTKTPEEQLIDRETEDELVRVLQDLSAKERLVITLFYYEGLTLTEIGRVLELSTSRISQIHARALFRLRRALKSSNRGFALREKRNVP